MSVTLETILDPLETRLPPGLISAESFAHIKSLGRLLAIGITYGLGFESRLADPSPDVDFILRPLAPHGLAIIADLNGRQSLPALLAQNHNWQRLRDLCRSWATPGSPLHQSIFCLWIEFDSKQYCPAGVSPSLVFVQLQRSCCSPGLYESIAQAIHVSSKGSALPSLLTENLLRCIELMPEKGIMSLFGLPIARPTDAFEELLSVSWRPDQIPQYVLRWGGRASPKKLESLIFSLGGYAEHDIRLISIWMNKG